MHMYYTMFIHRHSLLSCVALVVVLLSISPPTAEALTRSRTLTRVSVTLSSSLSDTQSPSVSSSPTTSFSEKTPTPSPTSDTSNSHSARTTSRIATETPSLTATSSRPSETLTSITHHPPPTTSLEMTASNTTSYPTPTVSASRPSIALSNTTSISGESPTPTTTDSVTNSKTHSGVTASSVSVSASTKLYSGPCVSTVGVGPNAVPQAVPMTSLVGATSTSEGSVVVFVVSAIDFALDGLTVLVSVDIPGGVSNAARTAFASKSGVPTLFATVLIDPSSAYIINVKNGMYTRMLGSADTVQLSPQYLDGNSTENHGILGVLSKKRAVVLSSITNDHALQIRFDSFSSYRIATDEFVVLNFYDASTIPTGCASSTQVVLRIQAFEYLTLNWITNGVCYAVLVMGLVSSLVGSPLALSHRAGSIAILGYLHFAQEDGVQLPLPINVLQVDIGTSKYRYVLGVLVVNTVLIGVFASLHYFAAIHFLPRAKQMDQPTSQAMLRHPFLTVALLLHLAPGMWFALGRNIGNASLSFYFLDFAAFAVLAYLSWIGFRKLVSSSMSVRFLPHKNAFGERLDHGYHDELHDTFKFGSQLTHGVDDNGNRVVHDVDREIQPAIEDAESKFDRTKLRPHAALIIREGLSLPSWFRHVMLWLDEEVGVWRSIDPQGTFLDSHGYVIVNYTKRGRFWLGLEQVETFLICFLTLIDNYTKYLALLQFGITCAIKIALFLCAVGMKPMRKTSTGALLFMSYLLEVIASLALVISGLNKSLISMAQIIQAVSCFLCALIIAFDAVSTILVAIVLSVWKVRRRNRLLAEARGKDALELYTSVIPHREWEHELDLVEGELAGSELGDDAKRRNALRRAADEKFEEYERKLAAYETQIQEGNAISVTERGQQRSEDHHLVVVAPVTSSLIEEAVASQQTLRKKRCSAEEFDEDIAELVGLAEFSRNPPPPQEGDLAVAPREYEDGIEVQEVVKQMISDPYGYKLSATPSDDTTTDNPGATGGGAPNLVDHLLEDDRRAQDEKKTYVRSQRRFHEEFKKRLLL